MKQMPNGNMQIISVTPNGEKAEDDIHSLKNKVQ